MRSFNGQLFNMLKQRTVRFVTAWLITRADGVQMGFTEHDVAFTLNGVTFNPENGMSGEALQTKGDFSTNNTTSKVVFSAGVTEEDVRSGVYDYADVRSFWVDPYNPQFGVIPIQRGFIGEIKMMNNQWTAEFRSIIDRMQQPYGNQYNLECSAKLGDGSCGVTMNPDVWSASVTVLATVDGDARIGTIVAPSTYNGFWYQCVSGQTSTTLNFDSGISYQGLGPDIWAGSGWNPFNQKQFGMWGPLWAQIYEQQLAQFNPPGVGTYATVAVSGGVTGATEPAWPTTEGATVNDGQVTWKAIPARIRTGSVTGLKSRSQFFDSSRTEPDTTYQYGWLQWLTGQNSGKIVEVRGQAAQMLTLLEVMPYPMQAGDQYQISAGCGKTRAHCITKFDNILNYRGFPDMPTEDRALQTPNFSTNNSDFNQWTDNSGGK